jgi:hypothetical protein
MSLNDRKNSQRSHRKCDLSCPVKFGFGIYEKNFSTGYSNRFNIFLTEDNERTNSKKPQVCNSNKTAVNSALSTPLSPYFMPHTIHSSYEFSSLRKQKFQNKAIKIITIMRKGKQNGREEQLQNNPTQQTSNIFWCNV